MSTTTKLSKAADTIIPAVADFGNGEELVPADFVIFYKGVPLKLLLEKIITTTTDSKNCKRLYIKKLCDIEIPTTSTLTTKTNENNLTNLLLLLTNNNNLYSAKLEGEKTQFKLKLECENVQDVGYCRRRQQLFIVSTAGDVRFHEINDNLENIQNIIIDNKCWKSLIFDPLELCESGIIIERLCCSSDGVLFLTNNGELYSLGKCGEIFSSDNQQPKHVRLYDISKFQLLDMVAGDDFFVLLLQNYYDEHDLNECEYMLQDKQKHTDSCSINSNISSTSSGSSSSCSYVQQLHGNKLKKILQQGHGLLHTQVHTFGSLNNGLLGTGDHMRRSSPHCLRKLDGVGVCHIAAGREHAIALLLDGRIYKWGMGSSAPTEQHMDYGEILKATCTQYSTVTMYLNGEIRENKHQLVEVQENSSTKTRNRSTKPMGAEQVLLASGNFIIKNHSLQPMLLANENICLNVKKMQCLLRKLMPQCVAVVALQKYQQQTQPQPNMHQLCQLYQQLVYCHAAMLGTVLQWCQMPSEDYFERFHIVQQARTFLRFCKYYTQQYCNLIAWDYLNEQLCEFQVATSATADSRTLEAHTFHSMPYELHKMYIQLLTCLKPDHADEEYDLAMQDWNNYSLYHNQQWTLAKQTLNFWLLKDRHSKLNKLRDNVRRRVHLSSYDVPLKLVHHNSILPGTHGIFVLCNGALFQLSGSQLQSYPLVTIWLRDKPGTNTFSIITLEQQFLLSARDKDEKQRWLVILQSLLNKVSSSNVRKLKYRFSAQHRQYAQVMATGYWRDGLLHGYCQLEFLGGKLYCGQMRHGQINGFGKMLIPGVGNYEGYFKDGKFHGHGQYEMRDNEIYEGYFRNGLFHGHGSLRSNYFTYMGEYQSNLRCGYGILDDMITGDKYMGMFADNKRNGPGTCITMTGDYFEGIYINDELIGSGTAIFENGYYYVGDMNMRGPCGKGTYYMPTTTTTTTATPFHIDNNNMNETAEWNRYHHMGNILSGQLNGIWSDVRVVSGNMTINRQFPKFPSSFGSLVVDNNRKWRALFDDFIDEVFRNKIDNLGPIINKLSSTTLKIQNLKVDFIPEQQQHQQQPELTEKIWSCIEDYIKRQRSRQKALEMQKTHMKAGTLLKPKQQQQQEQEQHKTMESFFSRNISLVSSKSQETLFDDDLDWDLDSNLSSTRLHIDTRQQHQSQKKAQSQETTPEIKKKLLQKEDQDVDLKKNFSNDSAISLNFIDKLISNSICSTDSFAVSRPDFDLNICLTNQLNDIKYYLTEAFKEPLHPLYAINQRIASCFHTSYGCWRVKPTTFLAQQAMGEWECISKEVYRIVRCMFPALPEDNCVLENTREVVSHITLLYPIMLSESIYSTLFVLYANKYNCKDETYRQNLLRAERMPNDELAKLLHLENSLIPLISHEHFSLAIKTLKELQEKYNPKDMLTVIETCMQQITETHQLLESENGTTLLSADSMMPLTLYLLLRAAVPHLGAELALLDDLTRGSSFQFEMNGMAGYCYTTLKAAYEHITAEGLSRTI